jgi:hypothetical protein
MNVLISLTERNNTTIKQKPLSLIVYTNRFQVRTYGSVSPYINVGEELNLASSLYAQYVFMITIYRIY